MEIFRYCKTQTALLLLLLFVGFLFIKDGNRLNRKSNGKHCNPFFDYLFISGQIAVLMDGITACTVNHLEQIPEIWNMLAHLVYLLSYQGFIFAHFMYWLYITDSCPRKRWGRILCYAPAAAIAVATAATITQIDYHIGTYTNYSTGIPAVISYSSVALYSILTVIVCLNKKNYIQQNKRTAFVVALVTVAVILLTQMLFNETLVASIAVSLVIMSIYLCMENPTVKFLEFYHDEMVTGFATLVENKDGSTGGHIRRSSAYAVIIAEELRRRPEYRSVITKDYIMNLKKAAPMHDIGKIGILDSILQKPGRLTEEEFAQMKKHPEIGESIISETFGHLDDDKYENMAAEVALGHHERWNGKGYPYGRSGYSIPLCARIMAVADVFDAVSAKRCYRDALPLEECFKIIRDGRGTDFAPDVVDAFFAARKRVEAVYATV